MAPVGVPAESAPRSEADSREAIRPRIRTNAGPIRTGVRVAYPPTGCPTKRPSPARWCSYAYCRSLHITSFRSRQPYPMVARHARVTPSASGGLPNAGRGTGWAQQLDGPIEDRVLVRHGLGRCLDRDIGDDPDMVDPALVRRQPLGDRQLDRAVLRQLDPLLD